jgi:hypothetical protein
VFFGDMLEDLDVLIREGVPCLRSFGARVLLPCWVDERLAAAGDDALTTDKPKNISATFMTEKIMC